jgi:RNA polymerase sigma factor (sigma-70 family)
MDTSTRREAFPLLVSQYQRRVYGIVRKMVISHDDADDIVQEVFVKVWNNLDNFKGESNLFTWMYRIATNESLQFLRKRRNQSWFRTDITEELENALVSDKHIDADEIQLKLQKAILKLPDKQRLVFNLKYFEELTYEQIAEITDSTVGSLKASFHHATKKIEEFLQGD